VLTTWQHDTKVFDEKMGSTKLPQITILKIAATALGETGNNLLAQKLNIDNAISSLLFIGCTVGSSAALATILLVLIGRALAQQRKPTPFPVSAS